MLRDRPEISEQPKVTVSAALDPILDALRAAGAAAVFDAASRTDIFVLTKRGGFGPITKIYASGDALLAAFASGGDDLGPADQQKLHAAPLRILAEIAPEAAAAAAVEVLAAGDSSEPFVDAAAYALAAAPTDAAVEALVRALRASAPDDATVLRRQAFLRREIVRALEHVATPRAGERVRAELEALVLEGDGAWRSLAPRDDNAAAALVHVLATREEPSAAALLVRIAAEHPSEALRKDAAHAIGKARARPVLEALAARLDAHVRSGAGLGALDLGACVSAVFGLDPRAAYDRLAADVHDGAARTAVLKAGFDALSQDAARDRTATITGPSEGWLRADPRWVDRAIDVLRASGDDPSIAPELVRSAVEALGFSRDRRALEPLVDALGRFDADVVCRALERIGDASIAPALTERLPKLSRRDRNTVEAVVRLLDPASLAPPVAPIESAGEAEPAAEPGHRIEAAKSGRAACRTCKEAIAKGELRLGEEAPNPFSDRGGTTYRWHHLRCAAAKRPAALKIALAHFAGEVPDRAELEAAIASWEKRRSARAAPAAYPYAERAPTGRSRCLQCDAMIPKGALRVAIEREVQAGAMVTKGPGYLHARCAPAMTGDPHLVDSVRANSPSLTEADWDELTSAVNKGREASGA